MTIHDPLLTRAPTNRRERRLVERRHSKGVFFVHELAPAGDGPSGGTQSPTRGAPSLPSDHPVAQVSCPTCGGGAGEPCDRRTLGRYPWHRARLDVYLTTVGANPADIGGGGQ